MSYRGYRVMLALLMVTGCGGGGGGGGSAGGGDSADTGIRVLHAVIDAPPLELVVSGAPKVIQTARFGERVHYGAIGSGPQVVTVRRVGESARVGSEFGVTVANNDRRSVLVFGEEETALGTVLFEDSPGEVPSGKAVVRVVNGVASARRVAVSVGDDDDEREIDLGQSSPYLPVSPGASTVTVRDGAGTILTAARAFEVGRAYTVLLAGERGYFVTATVLVDN